MDFWIEGAKSVLSRMWEKKNEEKKTSKLFLEQNAAQQSGGETVIKISCQYFPEQIQGWSRFG